MSSSHRIARKGGDEQDFLSRRYRRIAGSPMGLTRAAKTSYNRRQRAIFAREDQQELEMHILEEERD